MDIKIDRSSSVGRTYNEQYAYQQLNKYFSSYPFIESAKVFFRGDKHPTQKVKIHMRLKGKDVYAEGGGEGHDHALNNAIAKLRSQMEKYKTRHYRSAS
ncbi:MAG: HPF/RaiA family ribosome-associated protein [Bacteroidota bacterium]